MNEWYQVETAVWPEDADKVSIIVGHVEIGVVSAHEATTAAYWAQKASDRHALADKGTN